MPQEIELPNGEILEFPDEMGDTEISSAIQKNYPEFAQAGAAPQETIETAQPIEQPAQADPINLLMQKMASGETFSARQNEAIAELKKRGRLSTPGLPEIPPEIEPSFGSVEEAVKAGTKSGIDYMRPTIEGLSAVVGGIAGTPGGPLGVAGGGALGYTAAKTGLDRLDEWATLPPEVQELPAMKQMKNTMEDFRTGLAFEFGGPAVMKILGFAAHGAAGGFNKVKDVIRKNTPALSEEQVSKRAAEIIQEHRGNLKQYDDNLAESIKVGDEIPGFKSSVGQKTGDPGLIKLQRGLETKPGVASELDTTQQAENVEAIESFLKGKFEGGQTIDDVLKDLTKQKASLRTGTETAEKTAKATEEAIPTETPQVTGKKITETIKEAKAPILEKEKKLWKDVPNVKLDTSITSKAFKEAVEQPSTAQPIAKQMEAIYKQLPKTKDGLQTIDRELGSALANQATTDTEKRVLKQLRNAVEEDFNKLGSAIGVGEKYKAAKEFSKVEKFDKFGSGVMDELEMFGKFQGGRKLPAEKRPLKLMDVESADKFINAVGEEKAGNIMLRHYADDMAKKVKVGKDGRFESPSLTRWMKKNKDVLGRYGIKDQFNTTNKAHKAMQAAQVAEADFSKSIAAKMLNSDPQNAVAQAFSGGEGISAKNTGAIMRNLMKRVAGNKDAVKGLENGFKDFMYEQAKTTAQTLKGDSKLSKATLDKSLRRYAPAMAVLYKGQPDKIKALQTVRKALLIMNRTAKGVGGGPDTAEKMSAISSVIGAITHIPGIRYTAKLGKLGLGKLKNLNDKEVSDFVARLLYDPDLAKIINRASKPKPPVKKIESALTKYMERSLIQTGETITEENK